MSESKLNFKTETRHSIWHVKFWKGEYSDYVEKHLFFSANNPEEVWHYLKEYLLTDLFFEEDDYDKNYPNLYKSEEFGVISRPAKEGYYGWSEELKENNGHKNADDFEIYDDWELSIKPLDLIITR